jgi:hypothetical protein
VLLLIINASKYKKFYPDSACLGMLIEILAAFSSILKLFEE